MGGRGSGNRGLSKALAMLIPANSEEAWAHYALGCVNQFPRRLDRSLPEFQLALQLHPSFSPARGLYAVALAYCGRLNPDLRGGCFDENYQICGIFWTRYLL
jgi:hypothetical protein